MTIQFIYHHDERERISEFRDWLDGEGYHVTLAPLGHVVGSEPWKEKTKTDIEAAEVVLAFLTQKAVDDEWFVWRLSEADSLAKVLVPIKLEECDFPHIPYLGFRQHYSMVTQELKAQNRKDLLQILRTLIPNVLCFISYSRDDIDFVTRLEHDLQRHRVRVWRDETDIPPGASWDLEIQKALDACTHVLLIASPSSVESPNVSDEVSFALNQNKPVIPIILEECQLPLRVHRAQWVDIRDNYENGLTKLLKHLGVAGDWKTTLSWRDSLTKRAYSHFEVRETKRNRGIGWLVRILRGHK